MSENALRELLKKIYSSTTDIVGSALCDVILFGSYARGDYDSESDVDIALIINEDRNEIKRYNRDIINLVSDISLTDDVLVSVCCIPESEFEEYKEAMPFYRNIDIEGVRLSA